MTIQNYTPLSVTPGTGGILAPIPVPAQFFKDADVKVLLIDKSVSAGATETLLTLGVDYTLTKTFVPAAAPTRYTGSVSILATVGLTFEIVVFIDPANEQLDALSVRPFRPDDYERALDLSAMRDAATRELLKRCVRTNLSESTSDIVFPAPQNAQVIGWNGQDLTNLDPHEFVNAAGVATLLDLSLAISNLIATTLGGDPTFAATVTAALAGKARLISQSFAINVPAQYATVDLAHASLAGAIILPTVTVDIIVTGIIPSTTIDISAAYGERVRVIGANTIDVSVTGSTVGTGSAGDWTVTYDVPSSAAFVVGEVISIKGASGELHWGAAKVLSKPDATHVTAKVRTYDAAPPAGFTGTITRYPSQLFFNGVTAFSCDSIQILNIAIDGNRPAGDTFGLICKERTPGKKQGTVYMSNVAVYGFGAEAVRANYGCIVHCIKVIVSGSGNNGFMARDLAALTADPGCGSSGNGYRNIPGGNNGWLAQCLGAMLIFSAYSVGNRGDGYFSRSAASLIIDTGFPSVAAYNTNDYHYQGAFFQAEGSTSRGARTCSFFGEGGIRGQLNSAKSFSSQGNAFRVAKGGKMDAPLAEVTSATFNGFVADGVDTDLDATSSNVISALGTPYIALDRGQVIRTNATGLTTSNPVANVAPSGLSGYVRN